MPRTMLVVHRRRACNRKLPGYIAGNPRVIGLAHQIILCRAGFLGAGHGLPCRDKRVIGVGSLGFGPEDHGAYLGLGRAARPRLLAAARMGPVPVGGLRSPSISCFNTSALLRSSFLEANSNVRRRRFFCNS